MVKTLEKILCASRKIVFGTALALGVLKSNLSRADSESFDYFLIPRGINNKSVQENKRAGLIEGENEKNEIKSIGKYTSKEENIPKEHENFRVKIYRTDKINEEGISEDEIKFEYGIMPKSLSERTTSLEDFREDLANTHIYLALPKNLSVKAMSQEVYTILRKDKEKGIGLLFAVPFADTQLSKRLGIFNGVVDFLDGEKEKEYNELRKAVYNIIEKTPGLTGEIGEKLFLSVEKAIEIDEKKRLKTLEERFGKDHNVFKIPFYTPNGENPFKRTDFARRVTLFIDSKTKDEMKGNKAFLIMQNSSFVQERNGNTFLASIDGLVYEILLYP